MKALMMAPIYGFIVYAILFTPWPSSDQLFNPYSQQIEGLAGNLPGNIDPERTR